MCIHDVEIVCAGKTRSGRNEGGDMGSGVGERGFLGQVRAVQEATSEPPHTDSDQP